MSSFINATANNVGTNLTTVYTATNKCIIIGCNLTTVVGSIVPVDVVLNHGGTDNYIRKQLRIDPAISNEEIMKGNKIVMVSGDSLKVRSHVNSAIDVVVSILTGVS